VDKDCDYKVALVPTKCWYLILLMSWLVLMGDEERRCLAAGLCGGQQGGWQTKTERYSSSDMETGSMRAPKLNTQHQQPSFPDAEVAQSSTILGKS